MTIAHSETHGNQKEIILLSPFEMKNLTASWSGGCKRGYCQETHYPTVCIWDCRPWYIFFQREAMIIQDSCVDDSTSAYCCEAGGLQYQCARLVFADPACDYFIDQESLIKPTTGCLEEFVGPP